MTKDIHHSDGNFYRTSVKALIFNDKNQFLLTLENNGFWGLPGGGLDFGENPEDCLKREIKEELNMEVIHVEKQPSYFLTAPHKDKDFWMSNILYEARVKSFNFEPTAECHEIRFFSKEEALNENLLPNVTEFVKIFNEDNLKPKMNSI